MRAPSRGVPALLVMAAAWWWVGGAQADVAYPRSAAELAEQLRDQHVVVQQTMGSGDAAGAVTKLTGLAEALDEPVYVALVTPPSSSYADSKGSDDLLTDLYRILGKGFYVVVSGDGVQASRLAMPGSDATLMDLEIYANAEAVRQRTRHQPTYVLAPVVYAEVALRTAASELNKDYRQPNLTDSEIDSLAAEQDSLEPYTSPESEWDEHPWTTGKRFMLGTVSGLGSGLLVWTSIRGWPGWRRRPKKASQKPAALPEAADLRPEAIRATTRLAQQIAEMAAQPSQRLDEADLARVAAEALLGSDDPMDLLGAQILARTAQQSLVSGPAYRCCFFNPLHAPASTTGSWRFGEATETVPICEECDTDISGHRDPQLLTVTRGLRRVPYYETDTVWARTGFGSLVDDLPQRVLRDRGERR